MDEFMKLVTMENFAMTIALLMVWKTTSAIEKLTKSIDQTCARVNSLICFLLGIEINVDVDSHAFGDFMMKRLKELQKTHINPPKEVLAK